MVTTELRPTCIVLSSFEQLGTAYRVADELGDYADARVWDVEFPPGSTTLTQLINLSAYYDYAVALLAPDDLTITRGHTAETTRDNVLFELGLFLGNLGPARTFVITERTVTLPSDWGGVSVLHAPLDDGPAVRSATHQITRSMRAAETMTSFTRLPSTGLAIGYYLNFLAKVYAAFQHDQPVTVRSRNPRTGDLGRERRVRVGRTIPQITVALPRRLGQLDPLLLPRHVARYSSIEINTPERPFPFYVDGQIGSDLSNVVLIDVPTTMIASREAIHRIFGERFLAERDRLEILERREIRNFETTLRQLIPDVVESTSFRFQLLP